MHSTTCQQWLTVDPRTSQQLGLQESFLLLQIGLIFYELQCNCQKGEIKMIDQAMKDEQ